MKIKEQYALISVFDKINLDFVCKIFKKNNIKIISTGSTSKYIKKIGYHSISVSNLTKFKEILDGRVKTIHPKAEKHRGISLASASNNRLGIRTRNFH